MMELLLLTMGCLGPNGTVVNTSTTFNPMPTAHALEQYLNLWLQWRGRPGSVQMDSIQPVTLYKVAFTYNGQRIEFLIDDKGHAMQFTSINVTDSLQRLNMSIHPQKNDQPEVIFFVMSRCPFGDPGEQAMAQVLKAFNYSLNFRPVYILQMVPPQMQCQECFHIGNYTFYSMHGPDEVRQDMYEKAVFNLYGSKRWAEFVERLDACNYACMDEVLTNMSIKSEVDQYVQAHGVEILMNDSAITSVLMKRYKDLTGSNGFGSPTLYVNGAYLEGYLGESQPTRYRDFICEGFINPPTVCQMPLNETTNGPAPGTC